MLIACSATRNDRGNARKLDEARFFYQQLVIEQQHFFPSTREPEAFRFYFSAFVQAARAVPWRLGKEEPDRYPVWRDTSWDKTLTDEERKMLDIANELRIDEVHRDGIDVIIELEEIATDLLNDNYDRDLWRAYYGGSGSGSLGRGKERTFRPDYYLKEEHGKEQVTKFCKQYLDYLEKFVREFLKAHA
jgi:hypothetical protein